MYIVMAGELSTVWCETLHARCILNTGYGAIFMDSKFYVRLVKAGKW